MANYFVWRYSPNERFRAYGTRNHNEPGADDRRCVWRGASWEDAKLVAREMNRGVRPLRAEAPGMFGECVHD